MRWPVELLERPSRAAQGTVQSETMSVEVVVVNPASKMEKDEEELSEEQIQSLLLEAETRLKKASGSSSSKQDGDGGVVSLATGQEVGDSASRPKCVPSAPHYL